MVLIEVLRSINPVSERLEECFDIQKSRALVLVTAISQINDFVHLEVRVRLDIRLCLRC